MRPPSAAAPAQTGLAQLVQSIRYDDLPVAVVDYAKTLILDSLGCLAGGFDSPPAAAARAFIAAQGGNPAATLAGTDVRTSAPLAAFGNATALRYLDFNDAYSRRDASHPSGNLPALLAVGEAEGCSGKALITALVAAYEVQMRLCDYAGEPSLKKRGWHLSCNLALSAAAGVAKLLTDDAAITAQAIAISAVHQNTLAAVQFGRISMMKATTDAGVAKGGIEAAQLATAGLTGPEHVFDGAAGWQAGVAGAIDYTGLLAPIDDWRILRSRIKRFAAVGPAAAAIQAAVDLHDAGRIAADDIARIEVLLPASIVDDPALNEVDKRFPANRETADHSYHYCAVIGLLDGDVGAAQYSGDKLRSLLVRRLLERTSLEADAAFTAGRPRVSGGGLRVTMADGTVHLRRQPVPPGHADNPLSAAQIAAKFNRQAALLFSPERAAAIEAAVMGLDDCGNISELTALLAAG